MKSVLALILSIALLPATLHAQITVSSSYTDSDLAQMLAGQGVTISNIVVTCPQGSYGFFNGINSNIGVDSGLVLTTGDLVGVIGPNNTSGFTGSNSYFSGPNCDVSLDNIAAQTTYDCCIFEFDVQVLGDSLEFNYVFGSEEYLEYVGGINDVFGLFINGPGIVGQQNIALVPGTTTPVAISTINDVSNPQYYYDNGDGFTAPQNTDPTVTQYDGFTIGLSAKAAVIPCEVYHLKFAIADASDGILDSGVFIEAGSLTSYGISISTQSSVGSGFTDAVEGCVDGQFVISVSFPVLDTLAVAISVGGTATEGLDYQMLPDTIYFIPGGPDSIVIPVIAPDDLLVDPNESVQIWVAGGCNTTAQDTATIYIREHWIEVGQGPSYCTGDSALMGPTPVQGFTYQWTPTTGLSAPTSSQTMVNLPNNGSSVLLEEYELLAIDSFGCEAYDELTVTVFPFPPADAGDDQDILYGESANLNATGGSDYAWSPQDDLSDPYASNPIASPTATTTYTVTVTDLNGCMLTDTVTVNVFYEYDVFVPTAFTPNGDDNNDVVYIITTGDYELEFWVIFNRWGQEVFRTTDPSIGWDGTVNGKVQEVGVYAHYGVARDALGNQFEVKGNITLLK